MKNTNCIKKVHDLCRIVNDVVGRRDRLLAIADYITNHQKEYLVSGNWIHLRVLTYLEVSAEIPGCSETTTRRAIKSMKIRVNNKEIYAESLMWASSLPYICKSIVSLRRKYPKTGAPKICKVLNSKGMKVTERQIGKAIALLESANTRLI